MSVRFDLTDLRLFVHVAEAGSIAHGTDLPHETPPIGTRVLRCDSSGGRGTTAIVEH
jgi:hypothetical protein